MVASSAFRELSTVLAALESSGTDIQHAGLDEDLTGSTAEVTAELAVEVPVVPDGTTGDRVSITATDVAVQDGRVAVDLTVTVAGETTDQTATTEPADDADLGVETGTRTTPAYKDPDALRTVYERYDTFPEMTDALAVDVTSETVRRHMVKHGIHDPTDATPAALGTDSTAAEDDPRPRSGTTDTTATTGTDEGSGTTAEEPSGSKTTAEESTESEPPETQSAVTDGGSRGVERTGAEADTPGANRPVVDIIPATGDGDTGDGGGGPELPSTLTLDGLTAAINQSRTVHEVTQHADLDRETARELLEMFDLIHFVPHPLATDQVTVSPAEVRRRIEATGQ